MWNFKNNSPSSSDFFADEGEILVKKKLLSPDQLLIARIEAQKFKRSLPQTLLDLRFITDDILQSFFQDRHHIETVDLNQFVLEPNVIHLLPKLLVRKLKVIPLYKKGCEVGIAMADPTHLLVLDEIKQKLGPTYLLKPYFAKESSITEAIQHYYEHNLTTGEILQELAFPTPLPTQENPIIRLFHALLVEAVHKNASDIHLEPEEIYARVRYRLDGILYHALYFHKNFWDALCVHIKIVAGMNIAENRLPQTGRFSLTIANRSLDFRVSTHPTYQGESIVLRILEQTMARLSLENLGFSDNSLQILERSLKRPEGLIIVTGPTGAGKTTTLYALLNKIASSSRNIMTLEQPIEYKLPLIRQTEIRESGGLTFAEGVRSILRQDPDSIFIGEIRDTDTAQMACRAAMTGHQVYTTLHTNNVFGVIQRLKDLDVAPTILAGNLIAIVAQRLVRRLCRACKVKTHLTEAHKNLLSVREEFSIYEAKGCSACFHTGYKGRLPIVEILECSESINRHISTNQDLFSLEELAKSQGFVSLKEHAVHVLQSGETSLDEILTTIDFR